LKEGVERAEPGKKERILTTERISDPIGGGEREPEKIGVEPEL